MRQVIAVLVLACGFGVAAAAAGTGGNATTTTITVTPKPPPDTVGEPDDPISEHIYIEQIQRLKRQTWRWERLMGVPLTTGAGRNLHKVDKPVLRAVRDKWRRFHRRAYVRAHNPPHERAWL